MDVKITALTEPDELFCRYDGEHDRQPAHLALDLEDGELTAGYNGNIGSGRPESVYHRRTLWIGIPCLTADAANQLMADAEPIAQRILNGAEIEWDGNNHVGTLDADAQAAYDELIEMCDPINFADSDTVSEYDAGDWFSGEGSAAVIERLGLTVDTTDEQLAALARQEEDDARTSSDAGYVLLTGAEEYLTDLRDELREAVRDELRGVGEQVKTATARRDELIARVYAWGSDSDRAIGELAGVSHTAVQKKTCR